MIAAENGKQIVKMDKDTDINYIPWIEMNGEYKVIAEC